MNIIDILILAFILIGALQGYMRGLISSILSLLSSIIGFMIASWQFPAVVQLADQFTPLRKWLESLIYRWILPSVQAELGSGADLQNSGAILSLLPLDLRNLWESLTGPQVSKVVEEAARHMAGELTGRLLSLLAFIFLFFFAAFLLQFICNLIIRPSGSGGGFLSRSGGLVCGGLSVGITLTVAAAALWMFSQAGFSEGLNSLMQGSSLYPHLLASFQGLDQIFAGQISQIVMAPPPEGLDFLFKYIHEMPGIKIGPFI